MLFGTFSGGGLLQHFAPIFPTVTPTASGSLLTIRIAELSFGFVPFAVVRKVPYSIILVGSDTPGP